MAARIDKAAFTRADMVELIGAQLPVDAPGDPRELIEQIVDMVGMRISAPRAAHHREGHERFTVDAVIAEEERDPRAGRRARQPRAAGRARRGPRRPVGGSGARGPRSARSPYLVQPLQAPAGAGKTHSLRALRAAAHRAGKDVLVLAPTGKAVDEAMRDGAGDRGLTVAKALALSRATASSTSTGARWSSSTRPRWSAPPTSESCSTAPPTARAKMVLVGDPYQLAPVKARGGMFEQLCDELPWTQRLSEVWRMRDPEERDASLALRSGHGNRLRKAIGWYRNHDRLHTGDPVAMAADALDGLPRRRAATARTRC